MCDTRGVYRRLSTAKKAGKQLSTRIFCGTGFYKRRDKQKTKKVNKILTKILPGEFIIFIITTFNKLSWL